jgi:SH3-like domain-containing protein
MFPLAAYAEDLPRFASMRSDEVNVRTGPGTRYPIDWVFTRKDMPVMIVAEYEHWRRIRDYEGVEGWVHKALLSGKRTAIIVDDTFKVHRQRREDAPVVAEFKATLAADLDVCEQGWCRVRAGGYSGWIQAQALWGLDEHLRRDAKPTGEATANHMVAE